MSTKVWNKLRFILINIFILFLVSSGTIMIGRVLKQYDAVFMENEDAQLFSLAASVELSIDGYLNRYSSNIDYTAKSEQFVSASYELSRGNQAPMLDLLSNNIFSYYKIQQDIVILDGLNTVLSTTGRADYYFPENAGRDGVVTIRPCVDSSGGSYLAFISKSNSAQHNIGVLIELRSFYHLVSDRIIVGNSQNVFLLDAGGQLVLHEFGGKIHADQPNSLSENKCDKAAISVLLESQATQSKITSFYDSPCGNYRSRIAVVPAGENGFFAVGVSINYDEAIRPLKIAAVRLVAYGSMAMAGVLLLFGLAMWTRRTNEKALEELEILRKKNEAAEALNRQTQELAHHQRLETIGTLTSSIAHEFNNLLTPIMGYSILALEQLPQDNTDLYDSLIEIYNSSKKAKNIISRLSDLSRKNAPATFQSISIDTVIQKVLGVSAPVRRQSTRVSVNYSGGAIVRGNETLLSQMLLNLVLNSLQSIGEADGELDISAVSDGNNLTLTVSDSGGGIPPEVMPHIFDPFFTTKESGKGTGLGLAIVKQIIDEHSGSISVESTAGSGAKFTITLPIDKGLTNI